MSVPALWGLFNEVLMIASAIVVGFGWYFILHKRVDIHRKFMLAGSTLGAAFFVSYLASTFLIGDTYFGGPARYNMSYQTFLIIHILLATSAAVLGVITLRLALRGKFRRHRKVAPWTATFWFIAAITGLAVFLLLFVVFPPGPTTKSLVDIIVGR
jgi:putative membrane protein